MAKEIEFQSPMSFDMMCNQLYMIREKAAVELGKEMKKNEAHLHADYDLTLREIRRRLKAELSSNK